jgi:hypothetical protein
MEKQLQEYLLRGYHFFLSFNRIAKSFRIHVYSDKVSGNKFFSEAKDISAAWANIEGQIHAADTLKLNEEKILNEMMRGEHSDIGAIDDD